MLKSLASVMIGIVISGLTFFVLTFISRSIYPRPAEIAQDDKDALRQYFSEAPVGEMVFLAIAFIVSTFIASYFASSKSEHFKKTMGIISGSFMLIFCISIFLYLPYPKLYAVSIILGIILSMVGGAFLGSRSKTKV